MFRNVRVGGPVVMLCLWASVALGQPVPTFMKAKVELRWVEQQKIEGLTEDEGYQSSCDPDSIVYPHKKPALILTSAEVREAELTHHDLSRNGLSAQNYMVKLHLTKEARKKLAASVEGDGMRLLTVVIDGKTWGLHRYEKDPEKPFVPDQARAESFTPSVGFFSSKGDALRLVNAVKASPK
jgi:hypothetical protein